MYAPDLRAYRLDIRQVVNARYGLLGRERPWPWLQRRAPLWVLPDIEVANTAVGLPSSPTNGARSLTVLDSALSVLSAAGDFAQHMRPLMAGGEMGVTDRTLVTPGGAANWEDGPFVIELAEAGPTGPSRTMLHLDPRCTLDAIGSSVGTFTLRWPRYQLPPDLDVLERIIDDQGLELAALAPDRERLYQLDPARDAGTRPGWVLEDYGHRATYPLVVYPGVSDATTPNPDQLEDTYQRQNLTLRVTPSVSESGSGTFQAGKRLKVALCWWYSNRFGPLSPVTEHVISGTNTAVAVSGWAGKVVPLSSSASSGVLGRRLAVFVAEDDGAFYWRGFVNPASASSFTVAHSVDHGSTTALPAPALKVDGPPAFPRYDRLYPGGPYTYVRLYPRPTVVSRFELDYQARPCQLLEDTDEPEFPEQYGEVLVWAACLGMAERYARGTDTSVWKQNYQEWRTKLDQRYMPQLRYKMVRGAHGSIEPTSWLRREGIRYLG